MSEQELDALRLRVEELETLSSFQERTLSSLDGVLRSFTERVEALERELERIKGALPPDPVGPHHDPPPHY